MQVDNTSGPPAPDTLPPMPPLTSSALPAGTIPIPYFLVSLLSRSPFLSLTFLLLSQSASAPLSIAGSDGSLSKEGIFSFSFCFSSF